MYIHSYIPSCPPSCNKCCSAGLVHWATKTNPAKKKNVEPLRPCYTAQFLQQLATQRCCVASCRRIARCNRVARQLATHLFLLRATLHEVESSSTFRNNRSNLQLPLHSVTPLQQLARNFPRACVDFFVNPTDHRLRRAVANIAFSVQIVASQSQIALHGVTPHLGNCNKNIFQCSVASCWPNCTV